MTPLEKRCIGVLDVTEGLRQYKGMTTTTTTCPICSKTVRTLKNGKIPKHGHRHGAGMGRGGCIAHGLTPAEAHTLAQRATELTLLLECRHSVDVQRLAAADLRKGSEAWKRHGDTILGCVRRVVLSDKSKRVFHVAYRMERRPEGNYAVDMNTGLGPWEAIGTRPDAKRAAELVETHVTCCWNQRTLTPVV